MNNRRVSTGSRSPHPFGGLPHQPYAVPDARGRQMGVTEDETCPRFSLSPAFSAFSAFSASSPGTRVCVVGRRAHVDAGGGHAAAGSAAIGLLSAGDGWLRRPGGAEAAAPLWQAAVVTVVGFVCWYMGMQRIGAERATLFSGLVPVAAACTASLVGTGSYGPAQAAGSALVGAGWTCGGGAEPCRGLSGCRRGSRGRRAPGRRSSGSGRSRAAAPGARPG